MDKKEVIELVDERRGLKKAYNESYPYMTDQERKSYYELCKQWKKRVLKSVNASGYIVRL